MGLRLYNTLARAKQDFDPIDPADSDEAYGKNRRIELKLTEK